MMYFLPTAYVVREEVMFSLCSPFRGGGGTYSQVRMVGGGYLLSQVWVWGYLLSGPDGWGGGVPTFPGLGVGGTYSQVWIGGVPT